jgi:hypothetical protein
MRTTEIRESAEIIQFPARGRFAKEQEAAPSMSRFAKVAIGASWYHQDAIEEAERSRKN